MRRCANCQYENTNEAKACARCGQALSATPATPRAAEAPDWLNALQASAPAEGSADAAEGTSGDADTLAVAASLPVQVRRSRVPVLSVDTRRASATSTPPSPPTIAASAADAGAVRDEPTAGKRGNRLRLVLLAAIILALIVFLVLHAGA